MAVIGEKKHQLEKLVKESWEWNQTWVNHNTKKQSCLILLVHTFHFNLVELIFLK